MNTKRILELADCYVGWMNDSHREDWEAAPEWIQGLTDEENDLVDCFDRHAELAVYLARQYQQMTETAARNE